MKAKQISNYDNVQIIGQERLQKSSSVGVRKIVIIIFAVVIMASSVGCYFLITANRLKNLSYYMLILDKAATTVKAQEISESISRAGGSGYVINDGDFKISAALYKSLSDAEQVLERLKSSYSNAYILTYALKAKNVDKALKDALSYPVLLIDYILEQSLKLDLAEASEGSILLTMAAERTTLNLHKKTLENYLSVNPLSEVAQKAYGFYTQVNDNWDYAGSLEAGLGIYNHRLKYFSCFLIEAYANLRNAL